MQQVTDMFEICKDLLQHEPIFDVGTEYQDAARALHGTLLVACPELAASTDLSTSDDVSAVKVSMASGQGANTE